MAFKFPGLPCVWPKECHPGWDYETLPYWQPLVLRAAEHLVGKLSDLQGGHSHLVDTRPAHRELFATLTPSDRRYYAGHYRGEEHYCLRCYPVGVPSDNRVGYAPSEVELAMRELAERIIKAVSILDVTWQLPNAALPQNEKIRYVVKVGCELFELFLRIHPYANGNGHTARYLFLALLSRYGIEPKVWTIEPKPPAPYAQFLSFFRDSVFGDVAAGAKRALFEEWMLEQVIGPATLPVVIL